MIDLKEGDFFRKKGQRKWRFISKLVKFSENECSRFNHPIGTFLVCARDCSEIIVTPSEEVEIFNTFNVLSGN
ncbi:hypothetical protein [Flagellimonas sp. CMM7]|uniref:hypothetical protein n=1 Tax=Flagellimonas sp. CMM7 TaxID=2654676 RepID=UPI0013D41A1D|nr:hypothetical protein [Flagellimonas sp. CMM7]UII79579.1 hypothetical protein LV704_18200 [Flagellimonas sp. CMM7]